MPCIQIEDLYKIYSTGDSEVRALDGISLMVERGEFLAIVGHSGSGKSTLMNMLGCLDVPTSGRYLLEGQDVSTLPDSRLSSIRNRQIGFVFQGFNLVPGLSALENVELPLLYRGIGREQRRRMAMESLRQVGLGDRLGNFPAQLSGGEQQRVSIARALAKNPKILLCDEPTGALDYNTGKAVLKLLQDTCRSTGRTVIVITHNQALTAMADRVIHIKSGTVVATEVNENPTPVERIEW